MKKNFVLFVFVFCLVQGKALAAYDTTIVVGNIVGLKDSTIRLIIPMLDSAQTYILKVNKGKFEWKGVIAQPEQTYVFMQKHYMKFYLDTGNVVININANVDFLDKATVEGSKPQNEFELYNSYIADANNKYNALFEDKKYKLAHNKNKNSEVAWENERKKALSEITKKTKEFILDHPSSIVSLSLIEDYTKVYDNEIADTLYQKLSLHAQRTNAGIRIFKKLAIYKKTEIGQPFIDFVQNDTSGRPIKLSTYKGKYVLLDFWASWCGPCRAENPNLLKAYSLYRNKNFTILGISLDEDLSKWTQAIKDDRMPWQQVSDLKGFGNSVAETYGISAIPFNFLIDPNGIIIAKGLSNVSLTNKLAEVLGK